MILKSAYFETTYTVRHLSFNKDEKRVKCIYLNESMCKNSIYNLTAAIYQLGDATQELVEVKKQMIQNLAAEKKLLLEYLDRVVGHF